MENDLISVIIPVYNVDEYLGKCISSVTNQTYKNLEIILVDDESPDNSPQICDDWANKDSRIVVIHKKNEGAGLARNTGIENATGQYIMFVDADDYLSTNTIKILYERLCADGSDMSIGKYRKVFLDGTAIDASCCWMQNSIISKREAFDMLGSSRNFLYCMPWGKLYKKSIFDNLRFLPLKLSEDLEIFPKVINNCDKISIVDEFIYFYLHRESSAANNMSERHKKDSVVADISVSKFMFDLDNIVIAKKYYRSAIFKLYSVKMRNSEKLKWIKDAFAFEETKRIRSKDIKICFLLMGIYIPWVVKAIVIIKNKSKPKQRVDDKRNES